MCWKQMHRASCVAFFCDAFFRIRITTRVPQNSMNSCGFLVSTEKSRSQRFELTSSHTSTHVPAGRAHGGHWLRRSRARGAAVHRRRMVHPSIAGAWCILPSRARGASVDRGPGLHCGRGLQLSRAVLRPGMQPRVRAAATPAPARCASPWCRICMG